MKSHLGFNWGFITSRSSSYQREKIPGHHTTGLIREDHLSQSFGFLALYLICIKPLLMFLHALIFFSHFPCHLWGFFRLLCGKNKQFLCWNLWKFKIFCLTVRCCFVTFNENVNIYVKKTLWKTAVWTENHLCFYFICLSSHVWDPVRKNKKKKR